MNNVKSTRFCIRINTELYEWVKVYAQRMNTSASALVKDYFEALRSPDEKMELYQPSQDQSLKEQLVRTDSEIQHLRDQLTSKDNQLARHAEQIESLTRALDQSQQLQAIQAKTNAELTTQIDAMRQLEDMRSQRSWWKRIFER